MIENYARKVDSINNSLGNANVWYIPHHAVYHKKKPGKIRVVFDCSAIYKWKVFECKAVARSRLNQQISRCFT